MKWLLGILFLGGLVLNCQTPLPEGLEKVVHLPGEMKENSGLELVESSELLWMINDSGNKDHLYGLDLEGQIAADINIRGASNEDWEDLTADDQGNLYIADIGNNNFNRNELHIYKVPDPGKTPPRELKAETITFTYPGHKKDQPCNAEALVYFDGHLYIFTKNKRKEKEAITHIFRVPAVPGTYEARYIGGITLCDAGRSCRVTAADISPDGKTLALLGHDKIWLADNPWRKDPAAPLKSTSPVQGSASSSPLPSLRSIALEHRTQKEGLCFIDDATLYITDERDHGSGGILYRFSLKNR